MSRIGLYVGLIEGVLAHNSDKIAEDRVILILKQLYGPHPTLKKIEIFRDLTLHSGAVGYADIPDNNSSMAAFQAFLEMYYSVLAGLTGEEEATSRIKKPVKAYLSARWNEVVSTKIDWYLPNLTLLQLRKKNPDLSALSKSDQTKLFFETLYTGYITDIAQTITVSTYKKKLSILRKERVVAKAILLNDEGKVTITIPVDDPAIVNDLCHVFNAFVDLSAFTLGEEGALEKAQHLIGPVLKFFSPLSKEIGAVMHLIYGRLSSSLPSRISGLEEIMGGGFPKGMAVLFQVPSGIERNILWSNLLKDALIMKGSVVTVVTTRFPNDVKDELEKVGIRPRSFESKGKLVFVDWYSHKNERIVGIDVNKNIVKSGKDLTNLEIAMEKGIELVSGKGSGRILLDSVSAITKGFDSKSVYSFFQGLKKKAAERRMSILVFVEKEVHDQKTLGWLHQIFDAVADVEKTEKGFNIRMLSFRSRKIKTKKYPFTLTMKEVSVGIAKKEVDEGAILEMINETKKARAAAAASVPKKEVVPKEAVTAEDYYRLGVELASKRDYSDAEKSFRKAISLDGQNSEAYQALGAMLLYGTSDVDPALEALEKVVDLHPGNGDAWFDIGNARFKKGMIYEAKKAFLSALEVKPYYRWYNSKEFLCPSCHTLLSTGARRCMNCGSKLDATGRVAGDAAPASPHVLIPPPAAPPASVAPAGAPTRAALPPEELDATVPGAAPKRKKKAKKVKKVKTPTPPSAPDIVETVEEVVEIVDEEVEYVEEIVEERIFLCPLCGGTVGENDPSCPSCGAIFQENAEEEIIEEVVYDEGEGLLETDTLPEPTVEVIEEPAVGGDPLAMLEAELPEHIEKEEWDEVILLIDALIDGHGTKRPDWVLAKGIALTNKGDPRSSLLFYKEVLTENPGHKELLAGIAFALLKMGRYEDALKYADSCLKFHPDSPLAKQVKANIEGG